MMTRDRILETALDLFNQEGLVQPRGPGEDFNEPDRHRDRHQPGKSLLSFQEQDAARRGLVSAPRSELAPFMDSCVSVTALDDVWLTLHAAFGTVEKYRFVYSDIDYLTREYARLGKRIKKITAGTIDAIRRMCGN